MRERLRLLDTTLVPLADRSRDARITDGIISLALGAGLVATGLVLHYTPELSTGEVSLYEQLLWFQGGFMVTSGALSLLWPPARERLSAQYAAMPRLDAAQRRARVRFGEQALEEIAADGARRRILRSLAGAGLQLGVLGIIYRDQIFNGEALPAPEGLHYLMIGLTGVSIVTSLIGVFTRSEDERLRDSYARSVQILRDNAETPAD